MEDIINMMEETVLEKIDQIWQHTDYCKCDKCRLDIACYSLNHLPPRYVTSLKGAMLHKFDSHTTQSDAEITACVYRAIQMIGENPGHDTQDNGAKDNAD